MVQSPRCLGGPGPPQAVCSVVSWAVSLLVMVDTGSNVVDISIMHMLNQVDTVIRTLSKVMAHNMASKAIRVYLVVFLTSWVVVRAQATDTINHLVKVVGCLANTRDTHLSIQPTSTVQLHLVVEVFFVNITGLMHTMGTQPMINSAVTMVTIDMVIILPLHLHMGMTNMVAAPLPINMIGRIRPALQKMTPMALLQMTVTLQDMTALTLLRVLGMIGMILVDTMTMLRNITPIINVKAFSSLQASCLLSM